MRNLLKNQRKAARVISGLSALILIGLALRLSLPTIGCALMRHDTPVERPDFYVLLMGDEMGIRAEAARDAFEKFGPAPVVLGQTEASEFELAGVERSESQRNIQMLIQRGLPSDYLVELEKPEVTSTIEEATRVKQWAEQKFSGHSKLSFLVISSWSHTQRAYWIFSRVWRDRPEVKIMTLSSNTDACRTWWTEEESGIAVIVEYIKWIYYLMHY
jgi:uncharacterized SAM-binding protein YcdF (DUF218 family)